LVVEVLTFLSYRMPRDAEWCGDEYLRDHMGRWHLEKREGI